MGKKYLYLLAGSLLFICYQNFGTLTAEEQHTLERLQELRSLSNLDNLPQLAKPQAGRDLESVSHDWMQRQGSLWLDGRDQRWVESMNQRLNSWLNKHKDAVGPASKSAKDQNQNSGDDSEFRFTKINEMEYRWTQNSILTCSLQGDGAHVDYSRKLSANTRLGLDHWTGKSQTQVLLKYNW